MDDRVPVGQVIGTALGKGLDGRAVIAILELRNSLPGEVLKAAWAVLAEMYELPALDQIEFFGDDRKALAQWLADNTGQTYGASLIFAAFVDSSMGTKQLTREQIAIYSGLPSSVLDALLAGRVPLKILRIVLPQLASGLDFELEYVESMLTDAIDMASKSEGGSR